METIIEKDQLEANLNQLDFYLNNGSDEERKFAIDLIRRGKCFIAYKVKNQLRFAPSRFVGYLNNNIADHLNNETKDGKVTNPVIDKILGRISVPNQFLESEYIHYCNYLGEVPNRNIRKYWQFH